MIHALRWWLRRLAVVTERREGSDEQPGWQRLSWWTNPERDQHRWGGGLDR